MSQFSGRVTRPIDPGSLLRSAGWSRARAWPRRLYRRRLTRRRQAAWSSEVPRSVTAAVRDRVGGRGVAFVMQVRPPVVASGSSELDPFAVGRG